jgi:hypothetical protein
VFLAEPPDEALALEAAQVGQKNEAEFAKRKLKPRWVGALAESCVVVLKIPEG